MSALKSGFLATALKSLGRRFGIIHSEVSVTFEKPVDGRSGKAIVECDGKRYEVTILAFSEERFQQIKECQNSHRNRFWETDLWDIEGSFLSPGVEITDLPVALDDRVPPSDVLLSAVNFNEIVRER